jgi:hypothetical protein
MSSACTSTHDLAREAAATDMRCQPENVMVSLDSRPMVGTTRYAAEGCNKQRMYVCQKVVFLYGLPVSNARCTRERT